MPYLLLLALCVFFAVAPAGSSQSLPVNLDTVTVASGLILPVFMTAPPGNYNRLFVLEQQIESRPSSGLWIDRIRTVHFDPRFSGAVNSTSFLTLPDLAGGNEQGLLGLAFDPDYATNGKF